MDRYALPFFVISSDTMPPTLKINDLIIIVDGHAFNDTKVGDIIVFKKRAAEDKILAHRVTEITLENGKRVIITKGDANPVSVPGVDFPINYNNYTEGQVYYSTNGNRIRTSHKLCTPCSNIVSYTNCYLFSW